MDTLLYIAAGVVGIAVGAFGGFAAGRATRGSRARLVWTAAAILLIGVALGSWGQIAQLRPMWSLAMGLIAGGLTGLKYGRGGALGRGGAVAEPMDALRHPPESATCEPEVELEPDITRH
jgi:hypothetical protein